MSSSVVHIVDHGLYAYAESVICGPHGFREDLLRFIMYRALYKHMTPMGCLDPRDLIGRIYVGDYYTLLRK